MDRIEQLQDCLDKISEMFFTSVGVLQRDASLVQVNPDIPVTAWTRKKFNYSSFFIHLAEEIEKNKTDLSNLSKEVSIDIVDTVKVIDYLIKKLPGTSSSEEQQLELLNQLEVENKQAGRELEEAILTAEKLFDQVKDTMRSISDDQFEQYKTL